MTKIEKLYQLFKAASGVSTDTRAIQPNSIFFALKGQNFNGNKFAATAIEKGAAFAIIDEPEYKSSEKIITVENVLQTLKNLANLHRKTLAIPILGITGSNGKTTTKELIAKVLAQKYTVSYTQGNLNNHIGVPLTLLGMDENTEFGIVEMGANHPGEIAELCKIAEPDFGIITNIGKAHLEGFGSFEGVKKTKAELYQHLAAKNGTVFYNANNPILNGLAKNIENKVTFGTEKANFNGTLLKTPTYVDIKANFKKGALYLNTNLIGEYNFENVMAAACIGNYFDVEPKQIQTALKNYFPANNRSQLIDRNGLKIIMDAYNANPTSMAASIGSFLKKYGGGKTLILGDMLELGEFSATEHQNIVEMVGNKNELDVFLVGDIFSGLSQKYNCHTFLNVQQLCNFFYKHPPKNHNVLIKGSRGMQLEKVIDCF